MRAILAAALLAAALLPGCTDNAVPTGLTAREALALAEPEADAWDPGAELVQAAGFEVGEGLLNATPPAEAMVHAGGGPHGDGARLGPPLPGPRFIEAMPAMPAGAGDRVPGDGLAPVWVFAFTSGNGTLVVLVADGKAEAHAGLDEGFGPMCDPCAPLGDWQLDSDEAADVAAAASEDYAALRGDPEAVATMALAAGANGTYWVAALVAPMSGGTPAVVAVDAVTGEPADLAHVFAAPLVAETGAQGTVLTPFADQAIPLELAQDHAWVRVLVAERGFLGPPLQRVSVEVRAADGSTHAGSFVTQPFGGGSALVVVDPAPAGAYTVALRMDLGAYLPLEVSWCSDGEPQQPVAACAS